MKRVRVAPGWYVTISTELAEKAASVCKKNLSRDQVRDLMASEPSGTAGPMAGRPVGILTSTLVRRTRRRWPP